MTYSISTISKILTGDTSSPLEDLAITELIIDSRKLSYPESALFFALNSSRRDGHDFIGAAYAAGVRAFVVSRTLPEQDYPQAVFLHVSDPLQALQKLAAHHRSRFSYPVIGITGSNGKTVVKEWLYQLLNRDFSIVRSPRSYNSQIGVPLSIWEMDEDHTLGIFEAGISLPGEMEKLAEIIRPTIGVLTQIGAAHDEGFSSRAVKATEKRKLFEGASIPEPIEVADRVVEGGMTRITDRGGEVIVIPFTDEASVQNALNVGNYTSIAITFVTSYFLVKNILPEYWIVELIMAQLGWI